MKPATRSVLMLAAGAAFLAGAATASAQGSAAAAEALFEQGRADMAAGNYDAACAKFQQSQKLDPDAVGTLFNLGDCEEKRGHLATAWELFKAVEGKVAVGDERQAIAKARREAVEPRIPRLTIELIPGAPDATTVRVGGIDFTAGSFGIPLPLDPGEHELVVTAPGRAERRLTITLEEGKLQRIRVAPGAPLEESPPAAVVAPAPALAPAPAVAPATAGVPAPAAATQPMPASDGSRSASGKTLGYALGGVGVAGLVVGGVTGAMVLGKKSIADEHCYPELQRCDQEGIDANDAGRTLGVVSTTGLVVGVLGIGLGTYFILTSDDQGEPATALVTRVAPGATDLSLVRRW